MGDPHSPGMAIITCAWMKKEWMGNLDHRDKKYFTIKRFMDDIVCFYSKNPQWEHESFVRDFCKSEVYAEPLRLEDGKENRFLETRFKITATNKIDFWLKMRTKKKPRYGDTAISTATARSCKNERRSRHASKRRKQWPVINMSSARVQ